MNREPKKRRIKTKLMFRWQGRRKGEKNAQMFHSVIKDFLIDQN